jgi:hypothetical protein
MIDRLVEIYQEKLDSKEDNRWNFTKTFMNTRLYPLPILKRLRTGTTLKNNGWLLDVKKILWNNSHIT